MNGRLHTKQVGGAAGRSAAAAMVSRLLKTAPEQETEENMDGLKALFSRHLILLPLLMLIICFFSGALLFTSNPITVQMQSRKPDTTALSFSEALRTNNSYAARNLSVPSLQDFIDEWMATHQEIYCSHIVLEPTSGGPVSSSEVKQVSTAFKCIDETGSAYCFSMKNIVVEEITRNKWGVTQWEHIEESSNC